MIWWVFAVGFLTGSSGTYKVLFHFFFFFFVRPYHFAHVPHSFFEDSASCPADERISVFAETNNGYFAVWFDFLFIF